MKTEQEPVSEVLLYIEKEGPDRFKIQSDQLEAVGAKLRGPRQFSVFNSIILPLIVSVATVIFTGLFQFISWSNSVRLQNATDVANRAMESSEKVTAAIGRRRYATFVFISSLHDLVSAKLNSEKPHDLLTEIPATTGAGPDSTIGRVGLKSSAVLPDGGRPVSLDKLDLDLKKHRFEAYYEQLKHWNESIDQLMTDVDNALDRPIFSQAVDAPEARHEGVAVYYEKMKKINCALSLTDSLKSFDLNPDSLKLRLAGMNNCFIQLNFILARTKSATSPDVTSDDELYKKLHASLDAIHTMASEFRCYALHRVDYYKRQKEQSIFSPMRAWKWLTNAQKQDALDHFEETAKRCNPQNRPT